MRRLSGLLFKTVLVLLFALSIYDFVLARKREIYPSASGAANLKEEYDPSLAKLNSEKSFLAYADSEYDRLPSPDRDSAAYALIVGDLARNRFYHEYLTYRPGNNFLAWVIARITGKSVDEIWIPDHILKSNKAICGQQSMVVMSALKQRGFRVRAVYFAHPVFGGHFAVETYYKGGWHFFDPDIEPDADILLSRNRPSIAEIANDTALLVSAYKHRDREEITTLLSSYNYGPENQLVSPSVYFFQVTTYWLSQTLWIIILVGWLLFLRKKNYRQLLILIHPLSTLQLLDNKD